MESGLTARWASATCSSCWASGGPCGTPIAATPPQNIQDCMDRFSAESEDELALINCLETVSQ